MSNRRKSGLRLRLALGLAVLSCPLLASAAAQAALAGATPAQFTGVPNLRSATINSSYGNVVEVCFDKTLRTASGTTGFSLGGYRAANLLASSSFSLDQNNPNCEVVVFPATVVDENQYTFLEVAPGIVTANSPATTNLADSVALTGSTSHSGTTGVTTNPNLVGVLVPDSVHLSTNSLTYVFDKTTHAVNTADFQFETAAGQLCTGTGATPLGGQDSTTITIGFSPACGATVGQAVRAGILPGGVKADQDPGATLLAPAEWTVLPNCASPCATSRPDLVSAALGTNQDQIVFTFDKNVIVNPGLTNGFIAELATGQTVASTGATLTGANQVTATYSGNLSNKVEFAVEAYAVNAAAIAADNISPTGASLPGTADVGDNAGAFAAGFTTAPDSFGISINHSNGQIVVNLDDRLSAAPVIGDIVPYTAQGLPVAIAPTSVSYNSSAGPGPTAVTLQYSPSGITNVTALQFNQGAFTGPVISGSAADYTSVPQIDDPPNSAAILKAFKAEHQKQRKHQKHRRHLKHTRHHR
jgi:hypothetical protein